MSQNFSVQQIISDMEDLVKIAFTESEAGYLRNNLKRHFFKATREARKMYGAKGVATYLKQETYERYKEE